MQLVTIGLRFFVIPLMPRREISYVFVIIQVIVVFSIFRIFYIFLGAMPVTIPVWVSKKQIFRIDTHLMLLVPFP